jgi:hypothetical protein
MNVSRTRSSAKTAASPAKASSTVNTEPRHERHTTRTSSTEIDFIRFEALKGTYYHEGLEAHYDRIHRWLLFAVTLLGTATTAQLFSSFHLGALSVGLATTVVGLIDLVFDLSGKARTHGFLRRRFIELGSFCEDSKWQTSLLKERLHSMYADEPPQFHAATAIAYNNAYRTLCDNNEPEKMLVVPKYIHLFRNWWRFESHDFKRAGEIESTNGKPDAARISKI